MQQTIVNALYSAGEILKNSFGKIEHIVLKHDQSNVVTQADLDAEAAIVAIIERDYPNHSIIAEETGYRNKNSPYTWIVDPLDGTSNFASLIPWFGVIVAVLKDAEPISAGMYLPFTDQLYLAEKGQGAFLNNKKIRVAEEDDLKKLLFSYCLDYSSQEGKTEFEARIISQLVKNCRNLRATNSVTDFCYTADGKLGGCINQTTKIWDIAAPSLIITEAGGKVTDINNKPLDFNVNENNYLDNFTICASNPQLHTMVMQLIDLVRMK